MAANGFDITAWEQRMMGPDGQYDAPAVPVAIPAGMASETTAFGVRPTDATVDPPSATAETAAIGSSESMSPTVTIEAGPPTTGPMPAGYVPMASPEPSAEERDAAMGATRACRGLEPGSKEQRAWYRCLDENDSALARTVGAGCIHLIGGVGDVFADCMAEHGIYLNLPGPVAWPPEEEQQAAAACQPAASEPPRRNQGLDPLLGRSWRQGGHAVGHAAHRPHRTRGHPARRGPRDLPLMSNGSLDQG